MREVAARRNLTLLPRDGHEAEWAKVWAGLTYQTIDQAPQSLDYQAQYFRDAGWVLQDASVVIYDDNRPCGIWPLHVGRKEGEIALTMAGTPVQFPLFRPNLAPKAMRRMLTASLYTLRDYAAELSMNTVHIRTHATPLSISDGIDFSDRLLLSLGAKTRLHHELHIDLRKTIDQIRLNFRKSYRPLINMGLNTWITFLMDANSTNPDIWEEFRQLHFESSGKRWTRSKATWDSQYEILRSGAGFLVGLRDAETHRLTGGGFFQTTRHEGLYAVAAYDRGMFNKPLGHVVQYLAIKHMKALGLSSYRLGDRLYPGDVPEPSTKELDISYFKEGFASGIYRSVTYLLPARTSE